MTIKNINNKFRQFGLFQLKYRRGFILFGVALLVFGLTGLKRLQPHNSRESWFDDKEAIEINTKKFEKQFGNNENLIVHIQAKDIFHPEVLKMMKRLGNELLDSIPYANELTSLVDMEISVGTEEGLEIINPFEHGIPETQAEIDEIRKLIMSRRSVANKIVSDDCTEALIILSLNEFPPEEEWSKLTKTDPLFQVGEPALRILNSERYRSDLYTLKGTGQPYSETQERDFIQKEMLVRILSVFIAMLVLLILLVRSPKGVVFPLIVLVLSGIVMFGSMGWLGIGYDSNMVMLPALLGMALSVAYSIHLINAFKRFMHKTGKRKEAVVSAVEETAWPLLFTAITTIGSVASFATVGIPTITWVGYACAGIVMSSFIVVVSLLPAFLSFGKDKKVIENAKAHNHWIEKALLSVGDFTINKKKSIIIAYAIGFLALIPGLFIVNVDMDLFNAMGLKVPYVNDLHKITNSKLGAYMSYNLSIDFNEPDAIKSPEALKNFDALLDSIATYPLTKRTKDNVSIFSVLDIVKEMNQTLHSDSVEYYRVPDTPDEIAQILLLYEMSGGTKTFNWIDEDYSMLRAQVQVSAFNDRLLSKDIASIHRIAGSTLPQARVTEIGGAVQMVEIMNKIVFGELKSVLLSLIIISILLIIVFGSIKTGFIGLIPNLAPMLVIGAYLGYTGTSLNMMLMTIIPMMLGIAVDDTIHFINSVKYEFERCGNYRDSVLTAFATVGKSLAMTTIVLTVSFSMYMFSPINMISHVGLLSSIGLITALLTDYLVTPALILLTKPFGREVKSEK